MEVQITCSLYLFCQHESRAKHRCNISQQMRGTNWKSITNPKSDSFSVKAQTLENKYVWMAWHFFVFLLHSCAISLMVLEFLCYAVLTITTSDPNGF